MHRVLPALFLLAACDDGGKPGEWEGDYRFVGEGSCPAALLDDEGNAVDVSAFSFAGVAPM